MYKHNLKNKMIYFHIIVPLVLIAYLHFFVKLLRHTKTPEETEVLLYRVNEAVGNENFTYYSLKEEGRIKLTLESRVGDADLYISSDKRPHYQPTEFDYASTTCGVDAIDIPEDMKRPIIVGVYGHPSYETSKYTLSTFATLKVAPKSKRLIQRLKERIAVVFPIASRFRMYELLEGVFFML